MHHTISVTPYLFDRFDQARGGDNAIFKDQGYTPGDILTMVRASDGEPATRTFTILGVTKTEDYGGRLSISLVLHEAPTGTLCGTLPHDDPPQTA